MTKSIVPVKALPHSAPYKIHRYFARRPWNAFDAMIEALTRPGDVVLDPFAGGGTTIYESAKLGRAAIGCDINPLSNFIVRNMLVSSDGELLTSAASEIVGFIRSISRLTLPPCSKCMGELNYDWIELQHVSACLECGALLALSQANKLRPGVYACANQECARHLKGFKTARTPRLTPVYHRMVLSCVDCTSKSVLEIDSQLRNVIERNVRDLEKLILDGGVRLDQTEIPRNWDRQKEDLLFEKGFVKFSDLFTRRNFLINSLVKDYIKKTYGSSDQYESLRFIFSDSLRDTNSMSFTNKTWQAGKPTTWSKHAYWLPNEFCEVNVAKAYWTSYEALVRSHLFNAKNKFRGSIVDKLPDDMKLQPNEVFLHSGTIETLQLAPESVDVVITDPPYGSNVQYLELSHFWFPWNSDVYRNPEMNSQSEAVVNRKDGFEGAKGYVDYEDNLYRVFSSSFNALKPGGSLALTFNNKDLRAWVALIMSILRAGFRYTPESIVFQDGVQNYKQTAHTRFDGSPFGDFVYVFTKSVTSESDYKDRDKSDEATLRDSIDMITEQAFSLLEAGLGRDQILTKYFDKLVLIIQKEYVSHSLNTEELYMSLSASQLGKFYKAGKK